jgi:hypothetical protein
MEYLGETDLGIDYIITKKAVVGRRLEAIRGIPVQRQIVFHGPEQISDTLTSY